jgi:hypothetical protein
MKTPIKPNTVNILQLYWWWKEIKFKKYLICMLTIVNKKTWRTCDFPVWERVKHIVPVYNVHHSYNTIPQNVIISDNCLPFFILYHYFLSSSTINCVNLRSDAEFTDAVLDFESITQHVKHIVPVYNAHHSKNVKNIRLSMCDVKLFLTFASLSLVLSENWKP